MFIQKLRGKYLCLAAAIFNCYCAPVFADCVKDSEMQKHHQCHYIPTVLDIGYTVKLHFDGERQAGQKLFYNVLNTDTNQYIIPNVLLNTADNEILIPHALWSASLDEDSYIPNSNYKLNIFGVQTKSGNYPMKISLNLQLKPNAFHVIAEDDPMTNSTRSKIFGILNSTISYSSSLAHNVSVTSITTDAWDKAVTGDKLSEWDAHVSHSFVQIKYFELGNNVQVNLSLGYVIDNYVSPKNNIIFPSTKPFEFVN